MTKHIAFLLALILCGSSFAADYFNVYKDSSGNVEGLTSVDLSGHVTAATGIDLPIAWDDGDMIGVDFTDDTGTPAVGDNFLYMNTGNYWRGDGLMRTGSSVGSPKGEFGEVWDAASTNVALKLPATGSVEASRGVTLPDDQYISSGETSTSAVVYRLNNATNTGLGIGGISGRVGMYVGGNMAMDWTSSSVVSRYTLIPGTASVLSLGNTANPWDDTFSDDFYLQLGTTASEGKIHWEGPAGDASMALVPVKADGTAPVTAADAVALAVKLAASPGSGESVEALRVTSGQVLVGMTGTAAAPAISWAGDPDTGLYGGTNAIGFSTAGALRGQVNSSGVVSSYGLYAATIAVIDNGGTGSEARVQFTGSASTSDAARIEMSKADGTAGAPYDSFSFKLSNMGAPSSIEAMRITSGQVLIRDGVVGAPGLAFASNGDVGFYLTSNTMNLAINGAQRFAVDATNTYSRGNVVAGFGGVGPGASMSFPGAASSTVNTKIQACKADGTLAAPYDSMQVMLSDMGAPASIEAMRITSAAVIVRAGNDLIGGVTTYIPAADFFVPLSASGTNWVTESACAIAADSNNDGLTVVQCDKDTVEGFGIEFFTPSQINSVRFSILARAETSPGGAVGANLSITCRSSAPDALESAWGTARNLGTFAFSTNENWQTLTATVTAANLGIAANSICQCEIARQIAVPGDDLASDLTIRGLRLVTQ